MKKVFLTLALVFATSTVLVSCGDDATKDATPEATPAAEGDSSDADNGNGGDDNTTTTVVDNGTANA